jgi:D-alanyl-D-alanine carboxypeptidase
VKRRQLLSAACAVLVPGLARAAVPGGAGYFAKMAAFDVRDRDDVILDPACRGLLGDVVERLERVQATVGFANFGVIGFDEMLAVSRTYPSVGAFSRSELDFMERLFFDEASRLGFHGRKVVTRLTDSPKARPLVAVRGSPARLFDGEPLATFAKMRAQVGSDLVLTSGVRGVVKQFHLFLRKARDASGNLSLASRSLAPPGYSFHGVGDFDVGQRGLGRRNFTADFATTPVHQRLVDLGYLRMRYPPNNLLGVRYEPWHIRVVA